MRFYTSGGYDPFAPQQIRETPFDLLRSHLYPRDPALVRQAVDAELSGKPLPIAYLPQRMAFQKWKTPPYQVAWGQGAVSAIEATALAPNMIRGLQPDVPLMPMGMAGQMHGGARLPQPSDNMSPNLRPGYTPLARGVLPSDRYTTSAEVTELAYNVNAAPARNAAVAEARSRQGEAQAVVYGQTGELQRVTALENRYFNILKANAGVPWFMRSA